MYQPHLASRNVSGEGWEDDKLGRSQSLNLIRAERSSVCMIAYVEKQTKMDRVVASKKANNISIIGKYPIFHVVFQWF